jgi:hypothetical protein
MLPLLADIMFVSLIILRIMVDLEKDCFKLVQIYDYVLAEIE